MRVNYAIVFVSDMRRSVSFYRDTIGMPLRFESPHWTELKPTVRRSLFTSPNRARQYPQTLDRGPDRVDRASACRASMSFTSG
jgi:catechol 2,3-dioxygenase-like lactoylglutathione lyase family enzyme